MSRVHRQASPEDLAELVAWVGLDKQQRTLIHSGRMIRLDTPDDTAWMNLQVISAPDGEIRWVSGPLPGAVHDLTAARIRGIPQQQGPPGLGPPRFRRCGGSGQLGPP